MMNLDDMVRYAPLMGLAGTQQRFQQYADRERGIRYEDRIPSRELWGRAMSDQINQYFANLPQYIQMQRQHALDKEKLAYERQQREYQNKLNPLLLRQQQIANQIQEQKLGVYDGYYERIETLPIPEAQKEMLRGMTPAEGVPVISSIVQTLATRKPPTTYKTLPPNSPGNPTNVPIQQNTLTGEIKTPFSASDMESYSVVDPNNPRVQAIAKDLNVPIEQLSNYLVQDRHGRIQLSDAGQQILPKLADKNEPTATQKFKSRFSNPNTLQNFSDLSVIGINDDADQKEFVYSQVVRGDIDPNHHLAKPALDHVNRKHIKVGPGGVFISGGYKEDYGKTKPFTADAPQTYFVEPGDTVQKIVEKMERQRGIKVNPKQLVASNPQFFPNKPYELAVKEMPHSDQIGGALMTIPVGGGDVSEKQRLQGRDSYSQQGVIDFGKYGKIIPSGTTSVDRKIQLNDDYNEMVDLYQTVDQYTSLMDDINARGLLPVGSKERGFVQGLRWRLINKIQVLRDYGVLTPGEIDVIEKSAPNFNSFWNLLGRAKKGNTKLADDSTEVWDTDRFVKGVLQVLRDEGYNKAKRLRATMEQFQIPIIEYERSIETGPVRIYGADTGAFQGLQSTGGGPQSNVQKLENL